MLAVRAPHEYFDRGVLRRYGNAYADEAQQLALLDQFAAGSGPGANPALRKSSTQIRLDHARHSLLDSVGRAVYFRSRTSLPDRLASRASTEALPRTLSSKRASHHSAAIVL